MYHVRRIFKYRGDEGVVTKKITVVDNKTLDSFTLNWKMEM